MKSPNPDQRSSHLTEARNLKMARSSHAYVRGSTGRFYGWLTSSAAKVPEGPAVWICGDCHVGNLGPLANAKGRVALQVRDLDRTVIGNSSHDLIRLGLSLASAARGSNLPGLATVRILESLMTGYEDALTGSYVEGREDRIESKTVRRLIGQSTRRRWHHLAQERLSSVRPELPLGKRFWAIDDQERTALLAMFDDRELHRVIGALQGNDHADVEVVDAAYWMKGCSSLGRLRYAVMLRVGSEEDRSLGLVDVKEAVTAAAPRSPQADMPRDNAVRVVTGAKALSPHLGERMTASRLLDKAVVLRELMPQDPKLDVETLNEAEAVLLAHYVGNVVGRAHGRQLDSSALASWRGELGRAHATTIDARRGCGVGSSNWCRSTKPPTWSIAGVTPRCRPPDRFPRTRNRERMVKLEHAADAKFLAAMTVPVVACLLITFSRGVVSRELSPSAPSTAREARTTALRASARGVAATPPPRGRARRARSVRAGAVRRAPARRFPPRSAPSSACR